MESDSPVKTDNTITPTNPPSPPLTLASIKQHPTDMASRNISLAPDPSSIVVKWHGVSSICTSRWCMLPDRWNTVNKHHEADLKAMIADAFAFRKVVDDPSSYAHELTHTRAAADALRALLMNPLLHTLHSNIFKKVAKSPMRTKVRDWQDKRHSELSESTCHPPSYLASSQKPGHEMRSRLMPPQLMGQFCSLSHVHVSTMPFVIESVNPRSILISFWQDFEINFPEM